MVDNSGVGFGTALADSITLGYPIRSMAVGKNLNTIKGLLETGQFSSCKPTAISGDLQRVAESAETGPLQRPCGEPPC